MTLLDREEHFTKRQEAQQRRDVKVREAAAQYEADKADDEGAMPPRLGGCQATTKTDL
jgi:hypothetical protein